MNNELARVTKGLKKKLRNRNDKSLPGPNFNPASLAYRGCAVTKSRSVRLFVRAPRRLTANVHDTGDTNSGQSYTL